jgi:transposase
MAARAEPNLPDDVEALKALVREQQQALAALEAQKDAEIAHLHEQLRLALARRFGPSSERIPAEQLGLFNEAEAEAPPVESEVEPETVTVPAHTRARPGRRPLPEYLPRVEVVHELPEAERVCPHDGTALERIGEETREQLDVIPAKVQVIRHVRVKYACPCCHGHVARAPAPPELLAKSNASAGMLAYVATAKYVDALPLARQAHILERSGIDLPRATLASWMVRAGEAVQPVVNLLRERLVGYDFVQMDETPLQVLKEEGRRAKSPSFMWVARGGPPEAAVRLYHYDPSRAGSVPQTLLEGFSGILQSDGYTGYNAVVAAQGLVDVGCWAHARRKFDEAVKAQGQGAKAKAGRAHQALATIQRLYRIERESADLAPQDRQAARQARAGPVLAELRAWLDKALPQVPPKNALGKALAYLHGQWPRLTRYLDDGRIPIDNNACENAIRPFVLGRKNWLFADTPAGATASANLYTLVESARANHIEPYAYLRHLFTALPKARTVEDIEALLPSRALAQHLPDPRG